jgi:hypothetical protein
MPRTREPVRTDEYATEDQLRYMHEREVPGLRQGLKFDEAAELIRTYRATRPPTDEQRAFADVLGLEVREGLLSTELKKIIVIELNRRGRLAMAEPNTPIREGAIIEYKGQGYTIDKIYTKFDALKATLEPLPGRRRGRTYRRTDIPVGYLAIDEGLRELGAISPREVTI